MKFNSKKFKIFIGLAFALLIGWQAGWRNVGFDRENYINIYNGVISSDEMALKIWFAKDVLNLVIISAANLFNDDPRLAFLVTCALSFYIKYRALVKLAPESVGLFVILYALLLSPGLEFAAMRSGLAIAFIMLAVVYVEKKTYFYIFIILACMSHASMLAVIPFLHPVINNIVRRKKILLGVIVSVVATFSEVVILLFQHGSSYENNTGTVNAFFLPVVTLIVSFLISGGFNGGVMSENSIRNESINYIFIVVYCLIAMSFGFTFAVVTAATRYLEVAWCLILVVAVLRWRKSWCSFFGLVLLLIFLSFVNIGRSTWLAIYDPSFL